MFPFAEQDKLGEGLLKVDDGYGPEKPIYFTIGGLYGKYSRFPHPYNFDPVAPREDQDRLSEGYLKIYHHTEAGPHHMEARYHSIDTLKTLDEVPCFVASTVRLDTERMDALRAFRDQTLSQYAPGRAFIRGYYGGGGQAAARFIRAHAPGSISTIRKGLEIIVDNLIKKKY